MVTRPRVYLSRLPAPDGARAYALTLAPRVRWDGAEVKPARVRPCAGIGGPLAARQRSVLERFTRYLVRLVARKGA